MSKTKKRPKQKYEKNLGSNILVKLEDHWAQGGGWNNSADIGREPIIVEAAGRVVYEDDKLLQISAFTSPEGDHGGIFSIVKKCIVKRKKVDW